MRHVPCGALGVAVSADRPWADDISLLDNRMQRLVLHAVPVERPPSRGQPEHHRTPAGVRIVLEELNEPRAFVKCVWAVLETDHSHETASSAK